MTALERPARHIAADDRALLFTGVMDELGDVSSIPRLIEKGTVEASEAARFHSDVCVALWRLLDDIGWLRRDARDLFELTLPDDHLSLALTWMQFANGQRTRLFGERSHDKQLQRLCVELFELVAPLQPGLPRLRWRRIRTNAPTPSVTGVERELLRKAIVADLGQLPEIVEVIDGAGGDVLAAQLQRQQFEAEFSLLHDLGWMPRSIGEHFPLRTAPDVLKIALRHLAAVTMSAALAISRDEHDHERAQMFALRRCALLCQRLLEAMPADDGREAGR